MTAPTPNVPLLRRTLAHIEANPQEWAQETYHCRTAACFAGHAVILDGGEWMHDESEYLRARAEDGDDARPYHEGNAVWVGHRARRILGLTRDEANGLFDEENSLEALRAIVAELTGGAA